MISVRNALEKYKLTVSVLKKGYAQEVYRIDKIGSSFLGELPVSEVTSVEIAQYRDLRLNTINEKTRKVLSPASVRLEMSLLSHFFEIARIEWGLCRDNPVLNVRKPKVAPGRERRLTARENRMILRYAYNYANKDLYAIIVIALETAMRQGEILGLRWEYLDMEKRIAYLPETKNGTKRDVPLSLQARDVLLWIGRKNTGSVFGYSKAGLKTVWRTMLQTLKIEDLHFHDLRHEAVSRLFELGTLDIMEISAISGHKSLSMLKRYTHLKAHHLVKKLDGPRRKSRMALMNYLVPYPAVFEPDKEGVRLRILDFGLIVTGNSRKEAVQKAKDLLLRTIVLAIRDETKLPASDGYLEQVDSCSLVMIDPL